MTSPSLMTWEAAYQRFETPAQERKKFIKRLRSLGLDQRPRNTRILELFCGRGNGIHAWHELGFTDVTGVDLSDRLVAEYHGPGRCIVGDARKLPMADESFDLVCVQGGLHHLTLMDDLVSCLAEVRRVLVPGGCLVVIEPWMTPFLAFVHALAFSPARRLYSKFDALATMIEHEKTTYYDWLGKPDEVLAQLRRVVEPSITRIGGGKIMLVGKRR